MFVVMFVVVIIVFNFSNIFIAHIEPKHMAFSVK